MHSIEYYLNSAVLIGQLTNDRKCSQMVLNVL